MTLSTETFLQLIQTVAYKDVVRSINQPLIDTLREEMQPIHATVVSQFLQIQQCQAQLDRQEKGIADLAASPDKQKRKTRLNRLRATGLIGNTPSECKTQFIQLVNVNLEMYLSSNDFDVQMKVTGEYYFKM